MAYINQVIKENTDGLLESIMYFKLTPYQWWQKDMSPWCVYFTYTATFQKAPLKLKQHAIMETSNSNPYWVIIDLCLSGSIDAVSQPVSQWISQSVSTLYSSMELYIRDHGDLTSFKIILWHLGTITKFKQKLVNQFIDWLRQAYIDNGEGCGLNFSPNWCHLSLSGTFWHITCNIIMRQNSALNTELRCGFRQW